MPSLQEAFLTALNTCGIIRFRDKRLDQSVSEHYYVAIPVDRNMSLLLCIITSQVQKRIDYAKRMKSIDGLVKVSKKDIPYLDMESIIDCNQTSLVPKTSEKLYWLEINTFKMYGELSSAVRNRVFAAIRKSPVVAEAIKQMLPSWKLR